MFTPYAWYLLLTVCSADPAVGCDHQVIAGFMAREICMSAAVPIRAVISHVRPFDVPVIVNASCVAVETRSS